MKPLELHIYERDEDGYYIHPYHDYDIPDIDIDYWTECKRLTDAELAAEYWRASGDCDVLDAGYGLEAWSSDLAEAHLRGEVIERFATTPSYDEQDNA